MNFAPTCCCCNSPYLLDNSQLSSNLIHKKQLFEKNEGKISNKKYSKSKKCDKKKKPIGLIQKNIYDNLDYYKSFQNMKQHLIPQCYSKANQCQNKRECKPLLNQKSKKLFKKMKREKRLSPNVFQRLKNDQNNRSKTKILSNILRIKQVTPTKVINRQDLQYFATPKQLKYLKTIFDLSWN